MKLHGLHLLSYLLLAVGLGWVAYLLLSTLERPADLIPAHPQWLALATILLTASLLTNIGIFHLFLNAQTPTPLATSARLHVYGQILRYLPGRVWGIVYQTMATRGHLSSAALLRANLDVMIFMLLGNSCVSVAICAYRMDWPIAITLVSGLIGFAAICYLFTGGTDKALHAAAAMMPRRMTTILHQLAQTRHDRKSLAQIIGLFAIGWGLYLPAWWLLGMAYPIHAHADFIMLSALYTLASVVGILTAVTPAGLGVREVIFVILTTTAARPETSSFIALFARVWLASADIIILLCFLVYSVIVIRHVKPAA